MCNVANNKYVKNLWFLNLNTRLDTTMICDALFAFLASIHYVLQYMLALLLLFDLFNLCKYCITALNIQEEHNLAKAFVELCFISSDDNSCQTQNFL